MTEDDVWADRIRTAFGLVRSWEARTGTENGLVEPGSSLADDDSAGPDAPVSFSAWFGLQSSIDHLAQVVDVMTTRDALPLRPYAPFTLTRSALLAASQTVWLLAGQTRQERLRRSIQIHIDEWENERTYHSDMKVDLSALGPFPPGGVGVLDDRIDDLTRRIDAARATRPGQFRSTLMLKEAARWVSRDDVRGWQPGSLGREWRLGSAAAHSRQWPLMVRWRAVMQTNDEDDRIGQVSTPIDEIGTSIVAATVMAGEAFSLWDGARVRPT